MQPQFLAHNALQALRQMHPELIIHDLIDMAVEELFDIAYPAQKDTKTDEDVRKYQASLVGQNAQNWGEWIYYPWLNQVVHFPPKAEFRALRTSRNRNLITAEEQAKLHEATILIAGMSVGSNIVEALVSQGIAKRLILVDMDIIEPSNLNRIRSPYYHVGLHKVEAIARKVWEVDPFVEIVDYRDGLNEQNLQEILTEYPVDIVIDEIDELRMKIILREIVREHKIPVLMAADDGDNALLDIERFDLQPEAQLFGGTIPQDVLQTIKGGTLSRPQLGMMIGRYFVGPEHIPLRMYQSLEEVGKTLPSWPQLGGAAALSGIGLAYVAKKILLNHRVKTGRILISLDEKLDLEHLDPAHEAKLTEYRSKLESL